MTTTEITKARSEWRQWAEIARTRFNVSGAQLCAVCRPAAEIFIATGCIPAHKAWVDAAANTVREWGWVADNLSATRLKRKVARDVRIALNQDLC